jgi:hypothetical protein
VTAPAPGGAACPNCGAPISFRWAQAVQTTCGYCRSVLVRTDVDLARVGTQADFPTTGSPIQVGTEGRWRSQAFVVVGRITYQWDRGRWNEWHCILNDGGSAWLSDAQLEYAMTRQATGLAIADLTPTRVGTTFYWHDVAYEVAGIVDAEYVGTEGDLPFTTWDRRRCRFIDCQNATGGFATIDGSEDPPLLYLGEYVDFDALALRGVREFEGWNAT